MPDPGILILAAGSSSRMGQPKQLLKIEGQTLIRRITERAIATSNPVAVVLGASIEMIKPELSGLDISIIENKDWQSGMRSSFHLGLRHLIAKHPKCKTVLILLCDQPYVTSAYLRKLINAYLHSGKIAAASSYSNIVGVPAIFELALFTKLASSSGDFGARQLLKTLDKKGQVTKVSFPEGAIDLDRWEDYQRFIEKNK